MALDYNNFSLSSGAVWTSGMLKGVLRSSRMESASSERWGTIVHTPVASAKVRVPPLKVPALQPRNGQAPLHGHLLVQLTTTKVSITNWVQDKVVVSCRYLMLSKKIFFKKRHFRLSSSSRFFWYSGITTRNLPACVCLFPCLYDFPVHCVLLF